MLVGQQARGAEESDVGALTSFRRLERMTAFPPIAEIRTGILPDCDAVRSKGRAGGAPERTSARQDSPAAIAAPDF